MARTFGGGTATPPFYEEGTLELGVSLLSSCTINGTPTWTYSVCGNLVTLIATPALSITNTTATFAIRWTETELPYPVANGSVNGVISVNGTPRIISGVQSLGSLILVSPSIGTTGTFNYNISFQYIRET